MFLIFRARENRQARSFRYIVETSQRRHRFPWVTAFAGGVRLLAGKGSSITLMAGVECDSVLYGHEDGTDEIT